MLKERIDKRRRLKDKLRRRELTFGAWTSFSHPSITEIFCRSGVDFIGIDIEHSTISQEQSQRIIAAAQAQGVVCLPRIASHNMEMTKRLLDSGADGLIVPMVNRLKEVEEIVSWCKYAPAGCRSFGVARAQGYGFDFEEYVRSWNETSIIMPQIESAEAVKNIEDILSQDEVDGVMIGPYDMSSSLGIPGQLQHRSVKALCRQVLSACRKFGKSCGTQDINPDARSIKKYVAEGYNFIVLASDVFILWKWTEKIRAVIRPVQ